MASLFSPSTDFEDVVDGLEAVTLDRRGSTPNTSIDHALQRAITYAEIEASDGKYQQGDVRWHFPDIEVVDEPAMGDEIVDANGNRYTILDRQDSTLEHRWRLICRNVAVVYGLDDTVTIERATYTKGTTGADEPTWHIFKVVRARIQPMTTDLAVEHEAKRRVQSVSVFVAGDVDINTTDRIRGADDTVYKVTGYSGAERIGELATIEAEVTPWPLA